MFKFNGNTPKRIFFKGLNVTKLVCNGTVVWSRILTTITGYPTILTNSFGENLEDYKIYGNSIQNGIPTPDAPIEIENVGNKEINLFHKDNLIYGYRYDQSNNLIADSTYCYTGVPIKPLSSTITISGLTEDSGMVTELDSNGNQVEWYYLRNRTISLKTKTTAIKISVLKDAIDVLQIEDGFPRYKIPVKVSGKNLFDSEDWYNTLHSINSTYMQKETVNGIEYYKFHPARIYTYQYMKGEFKENTQYAISCKARKYDNIEYSSTGFIFYYTDGTRTVNYVDNTFEEYDYVLISEPNKTINYIALAYNRGNYVLIRDIQLEENNVSTECEPYVEPITTNIYLNEPLRKIGDYSDYIDFKNQKVYKNVEVIDDTGTLTLEESLKGVVDNVGGDIDLPIISTINDTNIITTDTTIEPSNMEIQYYKKGV